MEKNEVIIGTAERMGTNGEGIVKRDDATVFVPFLLPGERAKIKILQVKNGISYGRALDILTPAEDRVRPVCPVFTHCGGCQLQHLKYCYQLKFKKKIVEEALHKIGGLDPFVHACERSGKEYAYRNKLQLPVGRVKGKNVIGFYAERSHRIVPTTVCPIHPDWAAKVIEALTRYMEISGADGYDEVSGQGMIRHIVVREINRKYLVTLVCAKRELPNPSLLIRLFDSVFRIYSLFLNYHPEPTNVVFGDEFHLLKGEGFYRAEENGITYEAGANTFLQINEGVRGKLYESAVSLIGEGETVVDCYAGGGLLTARCAKKCGRAYGIEIVPQAHECAERLKAENGLSGRMINILGDTARELPTVLLQNPGAVVILDPPRSGVERSVVKTLLLYRPNKIVMISCNPATLARDLGLLCGTLKEEKNGELKKSESNGIYQIESVRPFDMFPQTKHVETLVLLSRKQPTGLSK